MLRGRQRGESGGVRAFTDLSQDVLLPHQFLPLSVGVGGDHRENFLAVVWHHAHKENELLQELRHKPGEQTEGLNNNLNLCHRHCSAQQRLPEVILCMYLLSFWTMLPY